jgi:hypothetical protein
MQETEGVQVRHIVQVRQIRNQILLEIRDAGLTIPFPASSRHRRTLGIVAVRGVAPQGNVIMEAGYA